MKHRSDELKDAVCELTWALLDGSASESQARRLQEMIATSEEARKMYFECIKLETHLFGVLADERNLSPRPQTKKTAA